MLQPKKSGKRNIAESYNRQFNEMGPLERGLLKLKIEGQDQLPEIPYTFSQDQLNSTPQAQLDVARPAQRRRAVRAATTSGGRALPPPT